MCSWDTDMLKAILSFPKAWKVWIFLSIKKVRNNRIIHCTVTIKSSNLASPIGKYYARNNQVSHVLTDKNKVINLTLLFWTTFLNVNKHPSMLLHIFTEAITNEPYQSPSHQTTQHLPALPSAGYSTQRKSHHSQFIFWHHHSASALGMQGMKFIVAGLIFHSAKIISLQVLTFGGIFGVGFFFFHL